MTVGWRADRGALLANVRARSNAYVLPYGAVEDIGDRAGVLWSDFLPRDWECIRRSFYRDTTAGGVTHCPNGHLPAIPHGLDVLRWNATVRFGRGQSTWEVYSRWVNRAQAADEAHPHCVPAPPAVRVVAARGARQWAEGAVTTEAACFVYLPTWAAMAWHGMAVRGGTLGVDVLGRLAAMDDAVLATLTATLDVDPGGGALCDVLRHLGVV